MITKSHISFLSKSDSILKRVIQENKVPQISQSEDYVLDLYKYIIFQQISTKAGNSIYNRFVKFYKNTYQHGGISMEEMLIPVITLESKKDA